MTERELIDRTFGVREAVMDAGKALLNAGVEVAYGNFMKDTVAHGAHELAAALCNGSGFVMYPRTANAKDDQGVHGSEQQPEEKSRGRSM